MAAMETAESLEDDEGVAARRARARNLLPEITRQVKEALDAANIGIDVFVMIPSGDAIASFGTLSDPPDATWSSVERIVSEIVQQMVGLERVRCVNWPARRRLIFRAS
jgi:hypothetical protein